MKKQIYQNVKGENSVRRELTQRILGWDTGDSESIGFQVPHDRRPLLYNGEGHQMTFGITGSGKAVSSAMPELLSWSSNALVLDTKGELLAVTSRWREKVLGHRIVTLDPFNTTELKLKDSLNPLDLADFMPSTSYEAANVIASLVTGTVQKSALSRRSSNDEYWQDQATQLLVGVIGAALEGKLESNNESGKDPFPAIQSLLKSDDVVLNLAKLLDKAPPSQPFRQEIASFLQTVDVTRSGILSSLTSHFRGLAGESVERTLRETTFDFRGFVDGSVPTTIYVVIPMEHLIASEKLIRLIMGTIMTALYTRRLTSAPKVLCQLDELAALGTFNPYQMGVTLFRGSSVVLHGLFQDIDQLFMNYQDAKTIINNTSVIRLLGASNYWQASAMSELFGISPRALMNLEPDEQLLFIEGRAQRCKRLNYLRDPEFAGRFEANPRYACADDPKSSNRRLSAPSL